MIKQGVAALLAVGAFVWLGGRAVAQQATTRQQTPMQQAQSGVTTLSASERQFLTKTAQDSIYELASAELALQRAQSNAVEQVALRIYNDHAQFNRSLLQLARKYNVNVPVELSTQDRAKLGRLSRYQGAAFDRQYTQELAKANADDISEFQRQVGSVNNQDVRDFIISFLPMQREHLELASSVSNGSFSLIGNNTNSSTGYSSNGTTGNINR